MQQAHIRPIQHYNQLLHLLNNFGIYQLRIIALMALYWMLSGLNEGVFNIILANKFSSLTYYMAETTQVVTIMLAVLFSLRFPRNHVNAVVIGVLLLGSLLLALGVHFQSDFVKIMGEFLTTMLHYAVSLNMLMVVLEYLPIKRFAVVLFLALVIQTTGKFLAVVVTDGDLEQQKWALSIVVPSVLLYVISALFVTESPRYWIDHNLLQAQKLLHSIATTNHLSFQPIEGVLQRQYFWHKVALTKYSLSTLYTHKSVSFVSCKVKKYLDVFFIQALLLGVTCRCSIFIQYLWENSNYALNDEVELIWSSTFQLLGIFSACKHKNILDLASALIKRRTVVIALNSAMLLVITILAGIELGQLPRSSSILLTMAIFGLSSYFTMALFYFLLLSAFEFYPHTIRTLACGVIYCLFRLGRLAFRMHIEWIESELHRNQGMIELMLSCSLVLVLHSWLMPETIDCLGRYDLPEQEKRQNDEY